MSVSCFSLEYRPSFALNRACYINASHKQYECASDSSCLLALGLHMGLKGLIDHNFVDTFHDALTHERASLRACRVAGVLGDSKVSSVMRIPSVRARSQQVKTCWVYPRTTCWGYSRHNDLLGVSASRPAVCSRVMACCVQSRHSLLVAVASRPSAGCICVRPAGGCFRATTCWM